MPGYDRGRRRLPPLELLVGVVLIALVAWFAVAITDGVLCIFYGNAFCFGPDCDCEPARYGADQSRLLYRLLCLPAACGVLSLCRYDPARVALRWVGWLLMPVLVGSLGGFVLVGAGIVSLPLLALALWAIRGGQRCLDSNSAQRYTRLGQWPGGRSRVRFGGRP